MAPSRCRPAYRYTPQAGDRCTRTADRLDGRAGRRNPLEARLGQAVTRQLQGLGVHDPQVSVERRPELPRSAGGKLKLVTADPTARPAHADAR